MPDASSHPDVYHPTAFAAVAVNVPLDRAFHYAVPRPLQGVLQEGMRVRVPFGRRTLVGYCVGFADEPEVPKCKEIIQVLDEEPIFDERTLALTRWMATYYCCGWGEALEAMLPAGVRKGRGGRTITLVSPLRPPEELQAEAERITKRAPRRSRALWALCGVTGEITQSELMQASGASAAAVAALARQGFARTRKMRVAADALAGLYAAPTDPLAPTPEQANALRQIHAQLDARAFGVILLYGVTGSGKTEVYLQALRRVVDEGRQGIVLVPEISLTPQTVRRFCSRFENVAVLHSHLTMAERRTQWNRIRSGEADVVIGARSAVFAPTSSLGLLVVDEEHENSFKQQTAPRYHARDVGILRAQQENALVLLGSATPSLESFYNAEAGKYTRLDLTRRVEERPLPRVDLIDMREEFAERKRPVLISRRLRMAVEASLARSEQVILFLNRRGFATWIHCKRCGHVVKCSQCDVAMTYHRHAGLVQCHYCNAAARAPEDCPECGAPGIRYTGVGTERVEEVTERLFPDHRLARMDSDSMRGRHKHRDTLAAFRAGKTDILLGTQMIAKGLDFPNVTVVGVINADVTLNLPDFRSAERTFQLLAQVAGRTGRSERGGRVFVQTFAPEHSCIRAAAKHDYLAFAKKELEHRKLLGYPPYGRLVRILVEGKREEAVQSKALEIAEAMKAACAERQALTLGPAPAPIAQIKAKRRWHIALKAANSKTAHIILEESEPARKRVSGVQVAVDVDPVGML